MIVWEQASDGNLECIVNDCYGVVGLANPRTGWSARVDGPHGKQIAPTLFHTAAEAKSWVEARLKGGCAAHQPARARSTGGSAQHALAQAEQ